MLSLLIIGCVCFSTQAYSLKNEKWDFLWKEPTNVVSDYFQTIDDPIATVKSLMSRVFGPSNSDLLSQFDLELISLSSPNNNRNDFNHTFLQYLDIIEYTTNSTTNQIKLRGSSTIALAMAFNLYLENMCNTTYDWRTYTLELPIDSTNRDLPRLTIGETFHKKRSVPLTYYENVCTVSYSQAFWSFECWEKHLDWMAMQGINFPLAFNGQEYIWAKTFYQFNFTSDDLASFFAGPAFYAWQRMGNIQKWANNEVFTQDSIVAQYDLQIQIIARMKEFGMTYALTCFAGHVPRSITNYYPNVNVTLSPNWAGFPCNYSCVTLLDFNEALYQEIGATFIEIQTKYYNTSHIYQCDTFNEMNPPSHNYGYLQSSSKLLYQSMASADSDAVWLIQGWLFLNSWWNNSEIEAYLSGVPNKSMIILDLDSNDGPIFDKTNSYYGKGFIWNTFLNGGGRPGLLGDLSIVGNSMAATLKNTTVLGIGITMEGIWNNYIEYEMTLKMAMENTSLDINSYVQKYAIRRYGLPFSVHIKNNITIQEQIVNLSQTAWNILQNTIYNTPGTIGDTILCVTPTLAYAQDYLNGKHPNSNNNDSISTSTSSSGTTGEFLKKIHRVKLDESLSRLKDIQSVWQPFIEMGEWLRNVSQYKIDLIDISRQVLDDLFSSLYVSMATYYNNNNITGVQYYSTQMLDLLSDMNDLLNTDAHWMLGPWLNDARNQAHITNNTSINKTLEANWYEYNARNQLTLWGPTHAELDDYAQKEWGGLVTGYYRQRWKLFLDKLIDSMENGYAFNQTQFVIEMFNTVELPFQTQFNDFPLTPINNTYDVACRVYLRWNSLQDTKCTL